MNIIVAVSNDFGMMFNHRRQSKDSILRQRIFYITNECNLFMNTYSSKQFEDISNIIVDDDCLENAADNDYVFVENLDVLPYQSKINKIILFYWNRDYPSDMKFDVDLSHWTSTSETDFVGSSHENITEKIYERN